MHSFLSRSITAGEKPDDPGPLSLFESEYADALRAFIEEGGEQSLHRAYGLGRRGLDEGVTILEMQRLHTIVLNGLLPGVPAWNRLRAVGDASQFFSETLSPFDMTFRGCVDTLANLKSEMADRRRAEEALAQSERYYKSLIENALDIVTILDSDGTIRYTSPSCERVLGYSQEALIGRNVLEFLHVDDVDPFVELCSGAGNISASTVTVEFRFRHKEGGWVILESIGKNLIEDACVRGIIVNSRDITERRNLEEIRRRFEFIVNAARDFMILVNARFELEAANAAYWAVLRRGKEEILGRTLQEVVGEEFFRSFFRDHLERCFSGAEVREEEWCTVPGWGSRYFEIECYPYRDSRSAVTHAVVILRDATDRKNTEEAIRETQRQRADDLRRYAQQIQQVQEEERRRIARELHDDVCQRLTALKLQMNVLEAPEEPPKGAGVRAVRTVKRDINNLINEVRRISYNLRPSALDHFGLATALRMLCAEYGKSNGMKVEFRTNITPHRRYDPDVEIALFRVAQEALSNCLKHAGVKEASLAAIDGDGRISLSVSDRGRGFDFREHAVHDSPDRHFGLINMRERVELKGGTFEIASESGKGTTVKVTLPVTGGGIDGEDQAGVRG